MKDKDIKITEDNWRKLNQFKYNLGAKNLNEVITALIKVVNQIKLAAEIKKEVSK
jgi:predicted CopG family antitoxin